MTEDGLTQRVWAVADPALQERVARDLAPRQALIADGHHRWATYRRLQAERHAAGRRRRPVGPRAGDAGRLAHLSAAGRRDPPGGRRTSPWTPRWPPPAGPSRSAPAGTDLESALTALQAADRRAPVRRHRRDGLPPARGPRPGGAGRALPADRPARWRSLDASVLHALLLERVWQVSDATRAGAATCTTPPARCGRPAGRRGRRADAAGRRRRRARAGRRRRADAAQVDVVRPEAAHRAGPAPARRLTDRPRRARRQPRRRPGATAHHLHLAAAGGAGADPPEPAPQAAVHLEHVARLQPGQTLRWTSRRQAAQSRVSTVGDRSVAAPRGRAARDDHQPEGHQHVAAGQLAAGRLDGQAAHQVHLVDVAAGRSTAGAARSRPVLLAARRAALPTSRGSPRHGRRTARPRAIWGRRADLPCLGTTRGSAVRGWRPRPVARRRRPSSSLVVVLDDDDAGQLGERARRRRSRRRRRRRRRGRTRRPPRPRGRRPAARRRRRRRAGPTRPGAGRAAARGPAAAGRRPPAGRGRGGRRRPR